jgi:biotin transporter BioY
VSLGGVSSEPDRLRCSRAVQHDPLPLAALVVLGFLVGIAGHIYGSKTTILTGIGLILLGSIGLPVALYLSDR